MGMGNSWRVSIILGIFENLMQFKIPTGYKNIIICEMATNQVKIGHYILGKTIGAGGFARVKMAKHDLTNIEVAVKIINKKNMKNKNMISKVKREIRILKFINHPNIIKLYEVLDTNNDIFVVMELANNGELFDNIQSKKISQEEAKFYFKQIINGVQYIHRNHISHRDLKPENILFDSNNLIKIGDFGLSNVMKDGKLLKTPCGSPYYAAPQIVSEKKYEGTSVDIWSCGVILFALNTGELPFNDDNITLLYKRIEHGAYEIPAGVSPYARDLISRMLQVDPRKRISIQDIKAHPWLRSQIPIYKKLTDQFIVFKEEQPEIDEQVLQQIKLLNLNFNGYTQEKIKKVILKRDDESFVIAYQLLKSDKDRKLYSEVRESLEQGGNTIFKKIVNLSLPQFPPPIEPLIDKFMYGRQFDKNPKFLAEKIVQVLRMLNIEHEIKNQQYCIKCSYASDKGKKSANHIEMRDQSEEHEYAIKKQDKFTKGVLRFTIQVYEVNRKTQTHLVDMCLNQGHPLVFFPLVRKFYAELEDSYYK